MGSVPEIRSQMGPGRRSQNCSIWVPNGKSTLGGTRTGARLSGVTTRVRFCIARGITSRISVSCFCLLSIVRNTFEVPPIASTICARLVTANSATMVTARSSARSALRKLIRSSDNIRLARDTCWTNVRAVLSFSAISLTRMSSETSVWERSSRCPATPVTASASDLMVPLKSSPLPRSAASPLSMMSRTAFVPFLDPAIPVAKVFSASSTSSKSTGVTVFSRGISAPSSSFGPLA